MNCIKRKSTNYYKDTKVLGRQRHLCYKCSQYHTFARDKGSADEDIKRQALQFS